MMTARSRERTREPSANPIRQLALASGGWVSRWERTGGTTSELAAEATAGEVMAGPVGPAIVEAGLAGRHGRRDRGGNGTARAGRAAEAVPGHDGELPDVRSVDVPTVDIGVRGLRHETDATAGGGIAGAVVAGLAGGAGATGRPAAVGAADLSGALRDAGSDASAGGVAGGAGGAGSADSAATVVAADLAGALRNAGRRAGLAARGATVHAVLCATADACALALDAAIGRCGQNPTGTGEGLQRVAVRVRGTDDSA